MYVFAVVSSMVALQYLFRNQISNVIYESERESDDSESLEDDAISKRVERPVSSPIEIIGSSKQDAMITSEENVEESSIMFGDEPSIHNISALFANRSTMLNNEDKPSSPVKRTKNLKIKEESSEEYRTNRRNYPCVVDIHISSSPQI